MHLTAECFLMNQPVRVLRWELRNRYNLAEL